MITGEILSSAIKDYEMGGLYNEEFLKKAHLVYNACATFPPNVLNNFEKFPYKSLNHAMNCFLTILLRLRELQYSHQ